MGVPIYKGIPNLENTLYYLGVPIMQKFIHHLDVPFAL